MKEASQIKCLLIGGAVLGIACAVLMGSFPAIFNAIVDGQLVIQEGAKVMESFKTPPVPIYLSFYLFNVTNPIDVQYYRAKPILDEIGPYVYEETRLKYDLEFESDDTTVKYFNNKTYFFREQLSNGLKESDHLITVNVIFVMLANLTYNIDGINLLWPAMEATMDIFEPRNVSEILFEGWELPYFDFDFSQTGIKMFENITFKGYLADILEQLGVENISQTIVDNKIGYFSLMNHTNDGLYKVSTGKDDIKELIYVREWNDSSSLHFWDDIYCDMINGTDGTQFPPRLINEDSTVRIFVTELCRSLYLSFEKEIDFYGIRALRFNPPYSLFETPATSDANKCFVSSLGVLGSSMMEMTPCMHIPLVMSTPHFYLGDGVELDKFEGLEPNKDLHDTVLDIEPTFGIPLSAHKRIQINLPLRKYGNLTSFMNFEDMIFPVLWADEMAALSEQDAKDYKDVMTVPYIVFYVIFGVLLAVAFVMLVVGLKKRHNRKNAPIV